jgi:hypothetical protein
MKLWSKGTAEGTRQDIVTKLKYLLQTPKGE